ncbi:MAG: TRAP transporter substrate-binding protein DctP [Bacillota bacterium]
MKKLFVLSLLVFVTVSMVFAGNFEVVQAQSQGVRISYNGPPSEEDNAVHLYASNFKRYLETRTEGEITVELYPDSQLGNEDERMELVNSGILELNIASYAGLAPIIPELFAVNIPFMYDDYQAAHIFFDESDYWREIQDLFAERSNAKLLESVEEGGFLAFTNDEKEIRTPDDFEGLRFRAMDNSQVALFEAFGASGTPIDWAEVYTALQTGVADGQMNPPMYIIIGSLYEVQDYMTLANIQYSMQFLVINDEWFESLSEEHQEAVRRAAYDANVVNRIEVETLVQERINFLEENGMEAYEPSLEENEMFREESHPAYIEWLEERMDTEWIEGALEAAEWANEESQRRVRY